MRIGDVFAGTYRIEAEVARGGMGVVYRAVDLGLDRLVALKVMSASLSRDETYRARFRREAEMAARIDHPHVVPVFHRGEHEGVMYVVMRLVDGIDLAELLRREGRLDLARTAGLVSQVAGALDAAHALGLVHRDVKPANILLQGADRALLTDFGLAKQAEGGDALTSANTLLGTAAYLAPEQAQGKPLDGRCDVYALAGVTYHCLSGCTPYPDGPALTVATAHVYDPVPDVSSVAPELHQAVVDVVSRGLAKSPADRWPTAGAFAAALELARTAPAATVLTSAIPAPGLLPAVAPPAFRQRSPTRWWAGLAALAVVGAGVTGFLLSGRGSTPTSSVPTPTVDRYEALIAKLPPSVYTGCHAAPAREVKDVVTAVDCSSTQPGEAKVLVSLFRSPEAMDTNFQAHYAVRLPDGKCSRQTEVRSTWERGPLACYTNRLGAAVLLYEYDGTALQLLAVRSDGDHTRVYAWWDAHRLTALS